MTERSLIILQRMKYLYFYVVPINLGSPSRKRHSPILMATTSGGT
jgi:hypothetical protein